MYKDLVYSVTDAEFSSIVSSSSTINEVAEKLGFKNSPGLGSRTKINTRIIKLGIALNKDKFKNIPIEKSEFQDIKGISKYKGDISELSVQLELLEAGVFISKPIGDNCPYDLIMDYNGRLYKVQIKTGSLRNNAVIASLTSSIIGKNKKYNAHIYSKEEVDIFAVHSFEYNTNCYFLNNGNMHGITLRPSEFVRQKNSNVIENFSLSRLLENIRLSV